MQNRGKPEDIEQVGSPDAGVVGSLCDGSVEEQLAAVERTEVRGDAGVFGERSGDERPEAGQLPEERRGAVAALGDARLQRTQESRRRWLLQVERTADGQADVEQLARHLDARQRSRVQIERCARVCSRERAVDQQPGEPRLRPEAIIVEGGGGRRRRVGHVGARLDAREEVAHLGAELCEPGFERLASLPRVESAGYVHQAAHQRDQCARTFDELHERVGQRAHRRERGAVHEPQTRPSLQLEFGLQSVQLRVQPLRRSRLPQRRRNHSVADRQQRPHLLSDFQFPSWHQFTRLLSLSTGRITAPPIALRISPCKL